MAKVKARTEGWGNVDNARDAHYFRDGTSLCRNWMTFGRPRWEEIQALGEEPPPRTGTCLKCWRKRAAEEAKSPPAQEHGPK